METVLSQMIMQELMPLSHRVATDWQQAATTPTATGCW